MEHVAEYLNFSEELKHGVEQNLFQEVCPLSKKDKEFILLLIHHHPNILLEILTIKYDFQPFSHTVVPFLVNKIADQVIQIAIDHPSVNTWNVIQFISYSSAVSFSEFIEMKELDFMKLSLDVSFQLLGKNISPCASRTPYHCFCCCW